MTYLTEEQAQQIEEAFENAESVAASINAGKHHVIQIDDEKCFWQREEWVRWAIDEVLPEIREALSAIRDARAQEQAEHEPVARHICNLWIDPITKEYVVDHCDHPIEELIPAYSTSQYLSKKPDYWLGYGLQAYTQKPFEGATPLYAAPVRTKDLTDVEDLQDAVTKALKKAFQLGQTYWQQADSESYAANKRANVTQELYWKLEGDTRAVIAADREKNK